MRRVLIYGVVLVAYVGAQYLALVKTPPDRMMGDVYRILFVHVPAAWMALLLYTVSFVASIGYLVRRRRAWDDVAAAAAEVAVVLTGLALLLGSIWGRPTWGVWWTWDPRLTTTALLFILYLGYHILRRFMDDPERRAKVAASVGVLVYCNVPIVYLSVKWWRSLHQVQSSPSTMAPEMVTALRANAFALLAICIVLLVTRVYLARRQAQLEEREALPPAQGGVGT